MAATLAPAVSSAIGRRAPFGASGPGTAGSRSRPVAQDPTTRTPPSPSRSRPRRGHHPRRHPRHHPRPHTARPRRRPAKAPATQAINEAERLRLDGPQPNRHPTKRGTRDLRTLAPQPAAEGTSRLASPPSSMTAVSQPPRPTSSLREWRLTSRGRREAWLWSSTAGSTTAPAPPSSAISEGTASWSQPGGGPCGLPGAT